MSENMQRRLRPWKALDGQHRSIASRSRLLAPLLRTHSVAGEMTEFEVPIRLARALMTLAGETGNRIGPELAQLRQAAGG
jgi:hypothetical protein